MVEASKLEQRYHEPFFDFHTSTCSTINRRRSLSQPLQLRIRKSKLNLHMNVWSSQYGRCHTTPTLTLVFLAYLRELEKEIGEVCLFLAYDITLQDHDDLTAFHVARFCLQ